jgi:hypothetical protein
MALAAAQGRISAPHLTKIFRSNNRKHFAGRGNLCRASQLIIEMDDEAIA